MESVPETQPENSSATSTPSGSRNQKGVGTSTSQSIGASSPEEILTQKLLASSERNADMHSDDESSNDDTQMTDDVSGSTEKLCNGNSNNKKIEIVWPSNSRKNILCLNAKESSLNSNLNGLKQLFTQEFDLMTFHHNWTSYTQQIFNKKSMTHFMNLYLLYDVRFGDSDIH